MNKTLVAGVSQMAPVWMDQKGTLEKMLVNIDQAAKQACQLLVFGEGLLPGYPFWIEHTDGARFNSPVQKEWYTHYLENAVDIAAGDLNPLCERAKKHKMALYVGCIEKSGHSVFCSLVYIDTWGNLQSVHRKLKPTYEERLVWSQGDGNGLQVHSLPPFHVGGLNCWENWMPLARTSLYGQGEDLHIAVWPGSQHNTEGITRFMAKEGRSYVISASGLLPMSDIPQNLPGAKTMNDPEKSFMANGGSCIAGPDGEWVVPPVVEKETLLIATLDYNRVRQERLMFDPTGHYSRHDVFNLSVNRTRNRGVDFSD